MGRLTDSLKGLRNEAELKASATAGAIQALNSQATQRHLEAIALVQISETRRQ